MTTPWKSQPKKFCVTCKCWFADNKVSIRFHENGLRHKGAVQAKLREMAKKGSEREKDERYQKSVVRKMEQDALRSQRREKGLDKFSIDYAYFPEDGAPRQLGPTGRAQSASTSGSAPTAESAEVKLWAEAKTEAGVSYYWSLETNETVWEPPDEGYLSLAEQESLGYKVVNETDMERSPPRTVRRGRKGDAALTEDGVLITGANMEPLGKVFYRPQAEQPDEDEDEEEESVPEPFEITLMAAAAAAAAERAARPPVGATRAGPAGTLAHKPRVVEEIPLPQSAESGAVDGTYAANYAAATDEYAANYAAAVAAVAMQATEQYQVEAPRVSPYGRWEPVPQPKPEKLQDFGIERLKKILADEYAANAASKASTSTSSAPVEGSGAEEPKVPRERFKEKTVVSLSNKSATNNEPVTFMKRKLAGGTKSLKRRASDDD